MNSEELIYALDDLTKAISRQPDSTVKEIFTRCERSGKLIATVKVFRLSLKIAYGRNAVLCLLVAQAEKGDSVQYSEEKILKVNEEWQAQQQAIEYFEDFAMRLPQEANAVELDF